MRRFLLAAFFVVSGMFVSGVSVADAAVCHPMAGLNFQQWYSACGPALQEAYYTSPPGIPFQVFVQTMYRTYSQPVATMTPAPSAGGAGLLCQPGMMQCFNHFLRSCQRMPTGGSWWITSAQRC